VAPATILFRWTIVESFLRCGIALTKVDELRPVFELAGHPLTESSNLKAFIPKILLKEVNLIKSELEDQFMTISFDGTTRLGEAVNLCAGFVVSACFLCLLACFHLTGPLPYLIKLNRLCCCATMATSAQEKDARDVGVCV